jgi:hypothetical protein
MSDERTIVPYSPVMMRYALSLVRPPTLVH